MFLWTTRLKNESSIHMGLVINMIQMECQWPAIVSRCVISVRRQKC